MDFIERLLGFTPDGGSGFSEWLMLAAMGAAALAGLAAYAHRRRPRR